MGDHHTVDDELVQAVQELDIPSCPGIMLDLAAEGKKEEPDLYRIEKLISSDVGLSAALIKTVNSPFYGLRNKVHSIMQAIHMLGLVNLSLMVSNMLLRDVLKQINPLEMSRFWDASSKVAIISAYIAERLPYISYEHLHRQIDKDEAYTYGLFQDCGILILLKNHPEYKQTLTLSNLTPDRKFTEIEEAECEQNHAMVGFVLSRSWGLPDYMCQAIRLHHEHEMLAQNVEGISTSCKDLIALGLLAEKSIQVIMDQNHSCEWEKGGQWVMKHFGINEADFSSIMNGIRTLHEEGNLSY